MPAAADAAAVTRDGPLYGGADAFRPEAGLVDAAVFDAAPDAHCPNPCNPGDDPCCPIDCAPGQTCGCSGGGICYFRCTGDSCNINCSGNASCSVDCGAATGSCTAMCSGSNAVCSLFCGAASPCSLQCMPESTTFCSGNAYVCGRTCP